MLTVLDSYNTAIKSDCIVVSNGKSLSQDGAIVVNHYNGTGTVSEVELLFWVADEDGLPAELTEDNTTYVQPLTISGSEYFAQSEGIATKNYGKTVVVCAKITDADGNAHYSDILAYSPENYAESQIDKATAAETLKELCRHMVIYGEAAKTHIEG